jgi:RNA 3'-terminal phosphate cyclase (ATP)
VLHVDGASHSGSGTLVRFAVALSAASGEPVALSNARARRPRPGLRPQHVAAVRACAQLCEARVAGVEVGSRELRFEPGARIRGGRFEWDIGTAGSATMLALGVLPVACLAAEPVRARIRGGVFQDFAPSPHHMAQVLAPTLARMGVRVGLRVRRAGYVPRGAGEIELYVEPAPRALGALRLEEAGEVRRVVGIAFASHLAGRRVAERMAQSCEAELSRGGLAAEIERVEDTAADQPGAGLAVWAETATDCRLGADRAGARGRSSESIGRRVARELLADLASGATVDRHLADQVAVFAALAAGESRYRAPRETPHLTSNLWLAEQFGAAVHLEKGQVRVRGLGLRR